MHDDATLLAAFGLASFALVAALIPLVGDLGRRRAFGVRTGGFQRRRTLPLLLLVVEVGAACALFAAGIRVHLINDDADLGLTVAWLVAMAGAFRVLVNVEGAAAVVASGAAIAVTVTASLQGQTMLADVAAILAGAGAAALLCSWHPARLRLTATGAVLLGFVFGSLALELRYPKNQPDGVSAVALVAFRQVGAYRQAGLTRREHGERLRAVAHHGAAVALAGPRGRGTFVLRRPPRPRQLAPPPSSPRGPRSAPRGRLPGHRRRHARHGDCHPGRRRRGRGPRRGAGVGRLPGRVHRRLPSVGVPGGARAAAQRAAFGVRRWRAAPSARASPGFQRDARRHDLAPDQVGTR